MEIIKQKGAYLLVRVPPEEVMHQVRRNGWVLHSFPRQYTKKADIRVIHLFFSSLPTGKDLFLLDTDSKIIYDL